jgi:hypothetical protein
MVPSFPSSDGDLMKRSDELFLRINRKARVTPVIADKINTHMVLKAKSSAHDK